MGEYTSCACVKISIKRSQRGFNTGKLKCGIELLKIRDLIKESLETRPQICRHCCLDDYIRNICNIRPQQMIAVLISTDGI